MPCPIFITASASRLPSGRRWATLTRGAHRSTLSAAASLVAVIIATTLPLAGCEEAAPSDRGSTSTLGRARDAGLDAADGISARQREAEAAADEQVADDRDGPSGDN